MMMKTFRFRVMLFALLFDLACAGAQAKITTLSVTPTSLTFSGQAVNTTQTATIILSNTGQRSLQVTNVALSGSAAFQITNWSGKVALGPGSSTQLKVTFTPTSATSYTGTLSITSNANHVEIPLSGTASSPASATVAVSISPTTSSVQFGQSQQFTASVSGTSNTGITWLVNGVAGGNSTVGTITSTGLYSAPAVVPANGAVTVTAQSNADPTKAANATVTITAAPAAVAVAVSPSSATLQVGGKQQFAATVTGTSSTGVNWFVGGIQGGNSTVGTITTAGTYTAPATVPSGSSEIVTAKSVADPTKDGNATVTIEAAPAPVTVTISPTSATVAGGNSQQFSATVAGSTNTALTWVVNGITGGNTTYGTISASGLYTAPPCPSIANVTVTAISVYDSTAQANSAVALTAPTSSSAQRYVAPTGTDNNDGTACHPWATIQHAANSVTAGVTVHVQPGTYNEAISSSHSGTPSARIRFVSESRGGAAIVAATTNVWYNSGSYVDIEGFDVSGGTTMGIKNSGSYVRVRYNTVHDIGVGTCPQGGAISDGNYTTSLQRTYPEYSDNYIYNVGLWPPGSCNKAHGIYFGHGNGTAQNNVILRVAGSGIHSYHDATDLTITNNTVVNSNDGILLSEAPGFTNANSYVANNLVANCLRRGYGVDPYNGTVTNYTFTNDLVFNSVTDWYTITSHPNSITADPLFVSYTGDTLGNYHLQPTSPAIDHGTTTGASATDYDGVARPQGTAIDMGAYEWHP